MTLYENWRIMTITLMAAQRFEYGYGMYKSGEDSVLVLLRAAAWLSRDGVEVWIRLSVYRPGGE